MVPAVLIVVVSDEDEVVVRSGCCRVRLVCGHASRLNLAEINHNQVSMLPTVLLYLAKLKL